MSLFHYEALELAGVRGDDIRIKITSSDGDTKWLSISATTFAEVARVIRETTAPAHVWMDGQDAWCARVHRSPGLSVVDARRRARDAMQEAAGSGHPIHAARLTEETADFFAFTQA